VGRPERNEWSAELGFAKEKEGEAKFGYDQPKAEFRMRKQRKDPRLLLVLGKKGKKRKGLKEKLFYFFKLP
jgi:hypothetical protein